MLSHPHSYADKHSYKQLTHSHTLVLTHTCAHMHTQVDPQIPRKGQVPLRVVNPGAPPPPPAKQALMLVEMAKWGQAVQLGWAQAFARLGDLGLVWLWGPSDAALL